MSSVRILVFTLIPSMLIIILFKMVIIRFSYSNNVSQLPQWLVPYSQTFSSFGGLLKDLSRFFKLAETKVHTQNTTKLFTVVCSVSLAPVRYQ